MDGYLPVVPKFTPPLFMMRAKEYPSRLMHLNERGIRADICFILMREKVLYLYILLFLHPNILYTLSYIVLKTIVCTGMNFDYLQTFYICEKQTLSYNALNERVCRGVLKNYFTYSLRYLNGNGIIVNCPL